MERLLSACKSYAVFWFSLVSVSCCLLPLVSADMCNVPSPETELVSARGVVMGWEGGQLLQERKQWADRLSLTVWFSRNILKIWVCSCLAGHCCWLQTIFMYSRCWLCVTVTGTSKLDWERTWVSMSLCRSCWVLLRTEGQVAHRRFNGNNLFGGVLVCFLFWGGSLLDLLCGFCGCVMQPWQFNQNNFIWYFALQKCYIYIFKRF